MVHDAAYSLSPVSSDGKTVCFDRLVFPVCHDDSGAFDPMRFASMQLPDQALIVILMGLALHGLAGWRATGAVSEVCGRFTESDVRARAFLMEDRVQRWNRRKISDSYPFLLVNAHPVRMFNRSAFGEVLSVVGISGTTGHRDCLGYAISESTEEGWKAFFQTLRERGLTTPRLITSRKLYQMERAAAEIFPGAVCQRCQEELISASSSAAPQSVRKEFLRQTRAVFGAADLEKAKNALARVLARYEDEAPESCRLLAAGFDDASRVFAYPSSLRPRLATVSTSFRKLRENLSKRERILTCYPDEKAVVLLFGSVNYYFSLMWFTSRRPFIPIRDYLSWKDHGVEIEYRPLSRRAPLTC